MAHHFAYPTVTEIRTVRDASPRAPKTSRAAGASPASAHPDAPGLAHGAQPAAG